MSVPERRALVAPPQGISPRLAQVIVEVRAVLHEIRTTYGLERRKEMGHGGANVGPDGAHQGAHRG